MTNIINWVVLIVAIFTSAGLIFQRDWRWGLGLLAVQYVCVFWLVQTHWTVSMASVKLVAGWMVCAVIGIAQLNIKHTQEIESVWPQGRLFHFFISGIIIATTFTISLKVSGWLGLNLSIIWGSLLLIGMGLLQLGISTQPFRVIIGLLTAISGFEIIYAAVESSALVAALLSIINLGLALSGAYFLSNPLEDVT